MMLAGVLLQTSSPSFTPSTEWVLIGGAVVAMLYIYLRSTKKKRDPLDKSPYPASLAQQRGVEREMQNLLVELANMSRQITAQLDTRTAKLEALLGQADERIAALQRAATAVPAASRPPVGMSPPTAAAAPEIDPRHQEVYDLIDQGSTPQQVAQQLGRPIGEIELILALRAR